MDENPYDAPKQTGLPKKRPGSLDPLQGLGVLALAVLIVAVYVGIKYGLAVFNAWVLGR